MAINIEWQVKPPSKVRRTSERTQYETSPKNAGTCIGLRRYLHEATQVSALKPHSFTVIAKKVSVIVKNGYR